MLDEIKKANLSISQPISRKKLTGLRYCRAVLDESLRLNSLAPWVTSFNFLSLSLSFLYDTPCITQGARFHPDKNVVVVHAPPSTLNTSRSKIPPRVEKRYLIEKNTPIIIALGLVFSFSFSFSFQK